MKIPGIGEVPWQAVAALIIIFTFLIVGFFVMMLVYVPAFGNMLGFLFQNSGIAAICAAVLILVYFLKFYRGKAIGKTITDSEYAIENSFRHYHLSQKIGCDYVHVSRPLQIYYMPSCERYVVQVAHGWMGPTAGICGVEMSAVFDDTQAVYHDGKKETIQPGFIFKTHEVRLFRADIEKMDKKAIQFEDALREVNRVQTSAKTSIEGLREELEG